VTRAPRRREERVIRVLDDALANQIAAGEVVERPASVVKELVENALDAGAERVRVDLEVGGSVLVRVNDDGVGMSRENARLSVLRHATSKLARFDDLASLASFGFRGEALPSIASVSRLSLRTRREADLEGTLVLVEGGGPAEVRPAGGAAGTTVEVRELFFNVPARRKFLKSVGTETAAIHEVIDAAALGEPGLGLTVTSGGRTTRDYPRAPSRDERVRAVHTGEALARLEGERGPLGVVAFLSRPERARAGATGLTFLVNGRPVRDRSLARAVALAYGSVLDKGRYPVGVVYLELPTELVDVNVHPTKAEVRFADGRAVPDAVYAIVASGLRRAFGLGAEQPREAPGELLASRRMLDAPREAWVWSGAPEGSAAPPDDPSSARQSLEPQSLEPQPFVHQPSGLAPPPAWGPALGAPREGDALALREALAPREAEPGAAPPPAEPRLAFGRLRFVGQLKSTYLLCEGDDGLYVLDQHAAAERVSFHRLSRGRAERSIAMQRLLVPHVAEVSEAEASLVEELADAIAALGLELDRLGPSSVAVRAVPTLLTRASPEALLRDVLDELGPAGHRALSGRLDLVLATMACHGSLRAGDAVAPEEARALLRALDEVDFAGHCPHGRPVVMRVPFRELEARVGRR
jgi:DNA mismatch repair protein MutL